MFKLRMFWPLWWPEIILARYSIRVCERKIANIPLPFRPFVIMAGTRRAKPRGHNWKTCAGLRARLKINPPAP